ncbi:MAG: PfkB family carbohydrate kinase [Opitutaceae bacterium]|jgi:sugar/nucleoside kinase (ribokinase family)
MDRPYDIVSIGHVDNGILIDRGRISRFTGGAVYYSSFAAKRSGARVCVVTKLNSRDLGILDGMKAEGIDVCAIPSAHTTSVENIFDSEDVDNRRVNLLAQADPFTIEDIPQVKTLIYNLAGLFAGEFPGRLIEDLSARGADIALDLQAMLRHSENGRFSWRDWPEKHRYLPLITYLKADSLESEVITGSPDRDEAAVILHRWGAREVIISHSSEVIAYVGTRIYRAPFNPGNLSGRTGRGDTVFIAYQARRLTHGIQDALDYAAALCSIKMESPGPFQGTMEDVLARIKGQALARQRQPCLPCLASKPAQTVRRLGPTKAQPGGKRPPARLKT